MCKIQSLILSGLKPIQILLSLEEPFKYYVIKRVSEWGSSNDYSVTESWYTLLVIFDYRLGGWGQKKSKF